MLFFISTCFHSLSKYNTTRVFSGEPLTGPKFAMGILTPPDSSLLFRLQGTTTYFFGSRNFLQTPDAGLRGGGRESIGHKRRPFRKFSMTACSSIKAMMRIPPPHFGHKMRIGFIEFLDQPRPVLSKLLFARHGFMIVRASELLS